MYRVLIAPHALEIVALHVELLAIDLDRPDLLFPLNLWFLLQSLLMTFVNAHLQLLLVFKPGILGHFDELVNYFITSIAFDTRRTVSVQFVHQIYSFALLTLPLIFIQRLRCLLLLLLLFLPVFVPLVIGYLQLGLGHLTENGLGLACFQVELALFVV